METVILTELEALAILGLKDIEQALIEDAKVKAIELLNKELQWANAKLTIYTAKEKTDKLFHGLIKDELIVDSLKVEISISIALIAALTTASTAATQS